MYYGAEGPEDLFRFRYAVYVEEMNRKQHYAQHDKRIIVDPLDEHARQLVAYSENRIVGCIRVNCLIDSDIGDYFDFYGLSALAPDEQKIACIKTRLMIDPAFRRTRLPLNLLTRIYSFGLNWGMRYSFMDCNAHLVDYFALYGCRKLAVKQHDEYGEVTIMMMDLHDGDVHDRRGSPLAPAYRAWRAKTLLPLAAE